MQLPGLSAYGVSACDIDLIVAHCRGGSMRTNPIALSDDELGRLLRARL